MLDTIRDRLDMDSVVIASEVVLDNAYSYPSDAMVDYEITCAFAPDAELDFNDTAYHIRVSLVANS